MKIITFLKEHKFIILIIILFILSFVSLRNSMQGEFKCIAMECEKWVTGDTWITNFCKPNINKTDMICEFNMDNKGLIYKFDLDDNFGKSYRVLLSNLDTDKMKGCINFICNIDIYVRKTKGGEK